MRLHSRRRPSQLLVFRKNFLDPLAHIPLLSNQNLCIPPEEDHASEPDRILQLMALQRLLALRGRDHTNFQNRHLLVVIDLLCIMVARLLSLLEWGQHPETSNSRHSPTAPIRTTIPISLRMIFQSSVRPWPAPLHHVLLHLTTPFFPGTAKAFKRERMVLISFYISQIHQLRRILLQRISTGISSLLPHRVSMLLSPP